MRRLFHIKYGFQKGSHKIKNNYKNKKYTIHKDIKNLKYVKTIKMYNILTQIHLNYKFKKITFKNIQIHGLSDCLAKGVKWHEMQSVVCPNSSWHLEVWDSA